MTVAFVVLLLFVAVVPLCAFILYSKNRIPDSGPRRPFVLVTLYWDLWGGPLHGNYRENPISAKNDPNGDNFPR